MATRCLLTHDVNNHPTVRGVRCMRDAGHPFPGDGCYWEHPEARQRESEQARSAAKPTASASAVDRGVETGVAQLKGDPPQASQSALVEEKSGTPTAGQPSVRGAEHRLLNPVDPDSNSGSRFDSTDPRISDARPVGEGVPYADRSVEWRAGYDEAEAVYHAKQADMRRQLRGERRNEAQVIGTSTECEHPMNRRLACEHTIWCADCGALCHSGGETKTMHWQTSKVGER